MPLSEEKERQILKELQTNLKKAIEEDEENRKMAKEDLEFVAIEGKQWPDAVRAARESAGRPCLTINKLPTFIDQVVGDERMNRPSIKVVPVDSKADVNIANILSGWIKHVQAISKSDVAIDHGYEHAATCGYGALRVVTEYVDDNSFEQEAKIKKIDNALAVYWGKHEEYDCSDSPFCILITDMDRDEYKETYEDEPVPFNSGDSQYVEGWSTKETVRLAEYFVKEYEDKKIFLLADGSIVDKLPTGVKAKAERVVKACSIKWYLCSGNKVLEDNIWVGRKYIPVIPIWGKEFNVAGKRVIRGLIRNAKDSQRMRNFWESADTEVVTMQPKVPYIVTPKQISGHEQMWNNLDKVNYPYLLANFDEKAPGWPKREAPPQASSAMAQKIAGVDQDIRDTIGIQRAGMGMQSNERSGAAIRERKMEGDVGTFAFIDNLSRSIEHLGRVLIDVAPGILDTDRIIRLGLDDGSFSTTAVNVLEEATGKILNDLTVGVYDVVVKAGPSFTTQRSEARQSMSEFIQYVPQVAPLIGDLYAKLQDWPGSEEVSQRLEFLLPPEIKAKKAAEEAKKAGIELPPPQAPAPPPPSPEELMKLEEAKIHLEETKLKITEMQIKLEQEKVKLIGLQQTNELGVMTSKESMRKIIDEIVSEDFARMGGEQSQTTPQQQEEQVPAEQQQVIPEEAQEPPAQSPAEILGRASGGPVEKNRPYIVGEDGKAELFVPEEDGQIIPLTDKEYEIILKGLNIPDEKEKK